MRLGRRGNVDECSVEAKVHVHRGAVYVCTGKLDKCQTIKRLSLFLGWIDGKFEPPHARDFLSLHCRPLQQRRPLAS